MSLEAYLSVKIKLWRIKLFSPKKALFVILGIISVTFSADVFLNFISNYEELEQLTANNETIRVKRCVTDTHYLNIWLTV